MKHYVSYLVFAGAALLGLGLFLDAAICRHGRRLVAQAVVEKQPDAKAAEQEPLDPAKKAVMANVRAFTEGFNNRDVKAILKLFAEDCVLTEADGETIRGLKELEAELTESFQSDPKAKISVRVESLQAVGSDIIIEEGKTAYYPDGKTLTAETDYQATHVKKGDRWLMTRVRSFNRVVLHPYDDLRELDWLIGDWIDEDEDSLMEASYRWDANKAFLLNDFSIRVKGQKVLTGTQRIGRDPLTKQLRAWVFDSEGGYAESQWTSLDDDVWVMRSKGVRADGKVVTMTNQLTKLSKDRFRIDSADRIVGDDRMPNFSTIAVRRPPQPK
jgi:uncharacterized protein (TIGR02246 family)